MDCVACSQFEFQVLGEDRPAHRYQLALKLGASLVKEGKLDFYFGDCELEDALELDPDGDHYIVCHYLRCFARP
jgi:hypothetical protein